MATPKKPTHKLKVICQVCRHPERHRIEMLRIAGSAVDALTEPFGLKRDAIYRHMAAHVDAGLKAQMIADVPLSELAARATAEGLSLIDQLHLIRSTMMNQMLAAAAINDHAGAAKLGGRALEVLQETGRLTGELLNSAPITNITNNTAVFMQSPASRPVS